MLADEDLWSGESSVGCGVKMVVVWPFVQTIGLVLADRVDLVELK